MIDLVPCNHGGLGLWIGLQQAAVSAVMRGAMHLLCSSRTVTYLLAMSELGPLRDFLFENGVDVAQLFALLCEFNEKLVLSHDDADLWGKHLKKEAIEAFLLEIDPKK